MCQPRHGGGPRRRAGPPPAAPLPALNAASAAPPPPQGTVRIWNLLDSTCYRRMKGHMARERAPSEPSRRAPGSRPAALFAETQHIPHHAPARPCATTCEALRRPPCFPWLHPTQGPVTAITSLAADGSRIVTGSGDATLRVWSVEQGMCERQLIGHGSAFSSQRTRRTESLTRASNRDICPRRETAARTPGYLPSLPQRLVAIGLSRLLPRTVHPRRRRERRCALRPRPRGERQL